MPVPQLPVSWRVEFRSDFGWVTEDLDLNHVCVWSLNYSYYVELRLVLVREPWALLSMEVSVQKLELARSLGVMLEMVHAAGSHRVLETLRRLDVAYQ